MSNGTDALPTLYTFGTLMSAIRDSANAYDHSTGLFQQLDTIDPATLPTSAPHTGTAKKKHTNGRSRQHNTKI